VRTICSSSASLCSGPAIALRPLFPALARVLGAIVAVLCAARLVLEATEHARAELDDVPRAPRLVELARALAHAPEQTAARAG
jgi:hypothetical protein